ncbi:MAG: hypothetical protein AAF411_14505 [Myxococcota bacterium]
MEPEVKKQIAILAILWSLLGGFAYLVLALVVVFASSGGVTTPPKAFGVAFVVTLCGLPFPMVFGWVPAAIRLARGKPRPWLSAWIMALLTVCMVVGAFAALVVTRMPR